MRPALAVTALLVVALAFNQGRIILGEHGNDVSRAVDAVIPVQACALADSSDYLIVSDRFVSRVRGCADNAADPYGTTIASGGADAAETAEVWVHAIERSDYLVYTRFNGRIPLSAPVRAELAEDFATRHAGSLLIYVRTSA